jgi:hypothetical protein
MLDMPIRASSAQVDKTATNRERPPCCAHMPRGHAAAALPSKMHFRRFICPRWRGDAERLPVLRAHRIGSLHCDKRTWRRGEHPAHHAGLVLAGTRRKTRRRPSRRSPPEPLRPLAGRRLLHRVQPKSTPILRFSTAGNSQSWHGWASL